MRRLIVCCDGTWQAAQFQSDPRKLTNISRLFTAIACQDTHQSPPIEQVKLYIAGPGTGQELVAGVISGALGDGLIEKVREAYYWLAANYEKGDEVHLYGFSRGGYLARLLSSLICLLGFLDPLTTLTQFPEIFTLLCSKRDIETKSGRRKHDELYKLLDSNEIKHRREDQVRASRGGFLVQVLGLFEAVPLFHFHALSPDSDLLPIHNPFSLSDSDLEPEIESAFQALAISEDRPSYVPVILKHDKKNRGQELLQVWFPGCHTDVGGGLPDHDLSDLSLNWLVSHIESHLSLNIEYVSNLSAHASTPWGCHKPHEGLGRSLHHRPRHLPHGTDDTTFQHFHQSLLEQSPLDVPPSIRPLLEISDHLIFIPLTPFEQHRKDTWPIQPSTPIPAPLSISQPTPPLDSPRLIKESPTVFFPLHREEEGSGQAKPTVTHSLATRLEHHRHLRRGYQALLNAERGVVQTYGVLIEKARGAGDLPSEARSR